MGGTVSCLEPGETAVLLNAAIDGDVSVVEERLAKRPLAVLHRGIGGLHDSAWHLAAAYGHANVLAALYRSLLAHKGFVAKRLRLKNGNEELTEDEAVHMTVNRLNVKGQTALMFACFAGQKECVEQLVKMGADPWIQDLCGGRTALHYAALHGHVDVVHALMAGVPSNEQARTVGNNIVKLVDVKTVSGFSPLHYAAYKALPGITRALLEHGANATSLTSVEGSFDVIQVPEWSTPLHVAAHQGNRVGATEMLQYYVARRDSGMLRDPRLCADRASRLPFHVARLRGNRVLAELLHPMTNLVATFGESEVEQLGAPRLAVLTARVLQNSLLALVDTADAKIATLAPEPGSPRVTGHLKQNFAGGALLRQGSGGKQRKAVGRSSGALADIRPSSKSGRGIADGFEDGKAQGAPRLGPQSPTGGGVLDSRDAQREWWATDAVDEAEMDRRASGLSASAMNAAPRGSFREGRVVGEPRPNDAPPAGMIRSSSLMDRLKGITRRSKRITAGGADSTGDVTPRSGHSVTDAPVPNPGQLADGMEMGLPRAGPSGLQLSPFAAISWGTTAMVASLPSHAQCSVCLEEGNSLVTVPCLHRLCAPCARRLVMGVTDKPLDCPLCRQHAKGFYAPHDITALVKALNMG